jgi:hypothetical protein
MQDERLNKREYRYNLVFPVPVAIKEAFELWSFTGYRIETKIKLSLYLFHQDDLEFPEGQIPTSFLGDCMLQL